MNCLKWAKCQVSLGRSAVCSINDERIFTAFFFVKKVEVLFLLISAIFTEALLFLDIRPAIAAY